MAGTKQRNVRMNQPLWDALERAAARDRRNISGALRELAEMYVAGLIQLPAVPVHGHGPVPVQAEAEQVPGQLAIAVPGR